MYPNTLRNRSMGRRVIRGSGVNMQIDEEIKNESLDKDYTNLINTISKINIQPKKYVTNDVCKYVTNDVCKYINFK